MLGLTTHQRPLFLESFGLLEYLGAFKKRRLTLRNKSLTNNKNSRTLEGEFHKLKRNNARLRRYSEAHSELLCLDFQGFKGTTPSMFRRRWTIEGWPIVERLKEKGEFCFSCFVSVAKPPNEVSWRALGIRETKQTSVINDRQHNVETTKTREPLCIGNTLGTRATTRKTKLAEIKNTTVALESPLHLLPYITPNT